MEPNEWDEIDHEHEVENIIKSVGSWPALGKSAAKDILRWPWNRSFPDDGWADSSGPASEILYPDSGRRSTPTACCGTAATPRPTSLRGTTPRPTDTDEGECLACHARGQRRLPATSASTPRSNGVLQETPDYASFDPRGECARP